MIARIGHVFGWAGNIFGGLLILLGLANYFETYEWVLSKVAGVKPVTDPATLKQLENLSDAELIRLIISGSETKLRTLAAFLAAGLAIFLIGRAIRYILAGSTSKI